ncbi:condensation domain-containing protein [Actinophytocola sp.]|uniref:condensation domain-containing protein n=1 Tax=Actinophytocola sp. TaxID=1872138 RepID=UPI00389B293D
MEASAPTRTDARRRRVRLTPLRSVPVGFTGRRAAEGPMTLGQLNILQWLSVAPKHVFATVSGELEVSDGMSVEDMAEIVAALLGRHEGLRTTYVDGARPRQVVPATGVLVLDVCSLGEGRWGAADRPAVAEALVRWLRAKGTPRMADFPVRVAVAVADRRGDGRVIACAAEFSHMAVDHQGLEIVKGEFVEMVRDRSARRLGEPRHQPLDQAGLEATPAARRQAAATLCYWQDQLERMPRHLYSAPGGESSGESLSVELSSVAAAMAVRWVAARTRASRSSIVLAAICAVLAQRTGYQELVFPLLSSNRFERHLSRYVGTLAQGCVATVDVRTGSFDALVKQAWTSVIEACRHGRYDAFERVAVGERIEHERGLCFSYEPLFNSLVAESWSAFNAHVERRLEQVSAALRQTELRWRPVPNFPASVRFSLNQIEGAVRLDLWSADADAVPRAEMESLLLAVERLLVAAAHSDLTPGQVREVIDLAPISRGPNWTLVDSCWVDLAEVQRLLDDALAPATAHLFPSVGGQPLVAYLVATDDVRTPEQAHARCMAALPDHPTALAPRHYVLCEATPHDPADLTAWHAVQSAGTGR